MRDSASLSMFRETLQCSTCVHLDDAHLLQLLQSLGCETEKLTIDLFVVCPKRGAKPSRLSRRLTELWNNPWKTHDAALTGFDTDLVIFNHGPRAEMGIVHDVCRIINRPCRHAGLDHCLHYLVKRML